MLIAAVLLGLLLGALIAAVIVLAMLGHQRLTHLTALVEAERRTAESISERVVALEKRKLTETVGSATAEAKKVAATIGKQWGAIAREAERKSELV